MKAYLKDETDEFETNRKYINIRDISGGRNKVKYSYEIEIPW
jgi:hypothetical protein